MRYEWKNKNSEPLGIINTNINRVVGLVPCGNSANETMVNCIMKYCFSNQDNLNFLLPYVDDKIAFKYEQNFSPLEVAKCLISAIKNNIDIWSITVGSGFGLVLNHIDTYFKLHPEDRPIEPIMFYGSSDATNGIGIDNRLVNFVSSKNGEGILSVHKILHNISCEDTIYNELQEYLNETIDFISKRKTKQECNVHLAQTGYTTNFSLNKIGSKQYKVVANAEALYRVQDHKGFKEKINRLINEGYKIVLNLEGFLHVPTESWSVANIMKSLIESIGKKNIAWIELGGMVTPEIVNIKYKNNKIENDALFAHRVKAIFGQPNNINYQNI